MIGGDDLAHEPIFGRLGEQDEGEASSESDSIAEAREPAMWMKNTLIPLDMVFIRTDGSVAGYYEKAEPGSKRVIASREPVKYVLELAGGQAQAYGLKPGDTVTGPALKQ